MSPGVSYRRVLSALQASGRPFLVGGAYALGCYTGRRRRTKDLDVMIRRRDWAPIARALRDQGFAVRLTYPHWLGKVLLDGAFVDVIFNSGNGLTPVDDSWIEFAVPARVLSRPVLLVPPEELLWSKAFVMERERYDGADIQHLLLARADSLDWPRLCTRFEGHETILLVHLLLFGYVFPGEARRVPEWVLPHLWHAVGRERADARLCRGTLLSRAQYLSDLRDRGLADARRPPFGTMTDREFAIWTGAIGRDDEGETTPGVVS